MAFSVAVKQEAVVVDLSGWDRLMNWRAEVEFSKASIRSTSVVDRSSLEELVDHRASGCGTHNGSKRPNRRRIGTMLGRQVSGKQFWAVPAGAEDARLLVLDLEHDDFARAVLAVDDPEFVAKSLERLADSGISQPEP